MLQFLASPVLCQLDSETIPNPPVITPSNSERYSTETPINQDEKEVVPKTKPVDKPITTPTVRPVKLELTQNALISSRGGAGNFPALFSEAQRLNAILNNQLQSERNWQIKLSKYQIVPSLFDTKLRDAEIILAQLEPEKRYLNIVNDTTFQPTANVTSNLLSRYARYAQTLEAELLPTAHIVSNEIRQGIAEQHHTLSIALQTRFIELRLGRCVYLEYNQRVDPAIPTQYSGLFKAQGVGDYIVWQDLKSNFEDVYYKLKALVQTNKEYPQPVQADVEAARSRIRAWKSRFSAGIGSLADMQAAYKDLSTIEQAILSIAQQNFSELGIEGWSEINIIKDRMVPLIDKAINDEQWY